MNYKLLIGIVLVVCFLLIVGGVEKIRTLSEPSIKGEFPPNTLEGCLKQRAILYANNEALIKLVKEKDG